MKRINLLNGTKRSLAILGVAMGLAGQADAATVSGTVFRDENRNKVIDAGELFSTPAAPTIYVYLVNRFSSPTLIIDSAHVAVDGTYSVDAAPGNYTLHLSTQQYAIGTNVGAGGSGIDHRPPAGFGTVGEISNDAGNIDNDPNGIVMVNVFNANPLPGRNFAIACARSGTSAGTDFCENDRYEIELEGLLGYYTSGNAWIKDSDPGGTWTYQSGSGILFDANAGTIQLTEVATNSVFRYEITGVPGCPSSSSLATVNVVPLPVTNQNVTICAGDSFCVVNNDGSQRSLNPGQKSCYTMAGTYNDTLRYAATGCDSIVITTVNVNALDIACGATATITGRVFNDLNNNTVIDGSGEYFAALPATLYVHLINSDNIIVGQVVVNADGTYSLPAYPNTAYTLKLSALQYPLGTKVTTAAPINTTAPAGWVTTGENGAGNTGSGDGTPDGSLALTTDPYGATNKNFGMKASGSLPMDLLFFEVVRMRAVAQLNWSTASERNSKGFEVERSADGFKWYSIGWTDSEAEGGNSNGIIAYGLTDNAPLSGRNFYRLKLIGLDGSYDYSPVHILNMSAATIMIAPNPAIEKVVLSGLSGGERIVVYDMTGREMYAARAAGNTLIIGLSDLSAGIYSIRILRKDGSISTHKLVKN